jgi:antitoxin CptB
MAEKSRLAWRCHRGMREMDLMFEIFLRDEYDGLSTEQKQLFEKFLDEADVDIYAWITGSANPGIAGYSWFISRLQKVHP